MALVNNHIHIHADHDKEAIAALASKLNLVIENQIKIMADLTVITQEVAENNTVMQSAIVLLQGLKQKLDEAGTDAVKLKELSDALDTNTNSLAAAVAANTPAE